MSRSRASSQKLRKLVFARDRGICAQCEADCEKLKRVYWAILDFDAQLWYGELLKSDGRCFWEADHVLEVVNNGSDSLRNLQTLCTKCHRAKSVQMMLARAFSAASQKPIHHCLGNCGQGADYRHGVEIMRTLADRYDARFFISDMRGKRLVVNIGPNLKPDYMRNAHPSVYAHQQAIIEIVKGLCADAFEAAMMM